MQYVEVKLNDCDDEEDTITLVLGDEAEGRASQPLNRCRSPMKQMDKCRVDGLPGIDEEGGEKRKRNQC